MLAPPLIVRPISISRAESRAPSRRWRARDTYVNFHTFSSPNVTRLRRTRIHVADEIWQFWVCSVDRDRLRERERQARAAMSIQAEQAAARGGPDVIHHHHNHHHPNNNVQYTGMPLFGEPVKVSATLFLSNRNARPLSIRDVENTPFFFSFFSI